MVHKILLYKHRYSLRIDIISCKHKPSQYASIAKLNQQNYANEHSVCSRLGMYSNISPHLLLHHAPSPSPPPRPLQDHTTSPILRLYLSLLPVLITSIPSLSFPPNYLHPRRHPCSPIHFILPHPLRMRLLSQLDAHADGLVAGWLHCSGRHY
jgi:hypothetical protein